METLIKEELETFKAKSLLREIRELEPLSSVTAKINGEKFLLFCGNDYLGLAHHPYVKQAAIDTIKLYGVGAGAARLISGSSHQHAELENVIAQSKRKEKALVFSAGYLANLGTLSTIAGEDDCIIMDKLSHASLIDAAKLSGALLRVYPHKNYSKCEELLERTKGKFKKQILVTDSVFSMDGDLADVKALAALKKKYDAVLMVDDAHGTGCLGITGGGALEDEKIESEVDVITGTLSKSVGCLGGFVAGSNEMIQYILNKARPFIFATALPPHICTAALTSFKLMNEDKSIRHGLWKNVQMFHGMVKDLGFEIGPITSPILPLLVGDESKTLKLSEYLYKEKILIPAIRYPTVSKGKARLRLTVSATHQKEDLDRLQAALSTALKSI